MCGIVGILNITNEMLLGQEETLYTMLKILQQRGPDSSHVMSLGKAKLGACRLSIVDAEFGGQPIQSSCTPLAICFNGEVYNFRELKTSLRQKHIYHSTSDTEVILHLFEEEGINAVTRLNGMFAFCITDGHTAYLVRDRFGVKPLYYSIRKSALLFASEAKALLTGTPEIYIEQTYDNFETNIGYETPFRNILELPPATYLSLNLETGQHTIHSYYTLVQRDIFRKNEKAAIEELRWLIKDAINLRTDTNLPYGCYISGGLDSAIISQLAQPKLLFAADVRDRPYMDESYFMRLLSQSSQIDLVTIQPQPYEFAQYFVEMVYALDFPTTTLASFVQFLLSKAASERCLRLMFSGIGADEYLGGYVRHIALFARKLAAAGEGYQSYASLFRKLSKTAIDLPLFHTYYHLVNRSVYNHNESIQAIRQLFEQQKTPINSMATVDMFISFPSLLRTDDRINMHFGIESRSPFLDYRIVDFAFSIEDHLKIRQTSGGTYVTKYILRKAFEDIIPPQIVYRNDKVGFPSPITCWLNEYFPSLVKRSHEIIAGVPSLAHLFPRQIISDHNEFSRKPWQLVQWAAWYLLFCQNLSIDDATCVLFER